MVDLLVDTFDKISEVILSIESYKLLGRLLNLSFLQTASLEKETEESATLNFQSENKCFLWLK